MWVRFWSLVCEFEFYRGSFFVLGIEVLRIRYFISVFCDLKLDLGIK